MTMLRYGNLVFHLSSIRTGEYSVRPVYDRSGLQWECNEITLDITGIVSEVSIASNKPFPLAPGGPSVKFVGGGGFANVGDSLPFTLWNTKDSLSKPQQVLQFIVDNETVIDLPRPLNDGTRLSCDPKGGPFPQRAHYSNFSGDKMAVLSFRVVAYDTNCDNYILSHAWRIVSSMDQHGITTRTVQGVATFRRDFLINEDLQPDDFRKWLFPFSASGTRRVGAQVEQPDGGDTIVYTVVDREVQYGLGLSSESVEVSGSITSSVDLPIKDLQSALTTAGAVAMNIMNPFATIGTLITLTVPLQKNIGIARAIGRKGASREGLAALAANFIVDRFRKIIIDTRFCLPYCGVTHNIDSDHNPFAEVRMEILGLTKTAVSAVLEANPTIGINVSNEYNLGGGVGPFDFGPARLLNGNSQGPRLASSENSRGTWLHRMVSQALTEPSDTTCNLPGDVPADEESQDTGEIA